MPGIDERQDDDAPPASLAERLQTLLRQAGHRDHGHAFYRYAFLSSLGLGALALAVSFFFLPLATSILVAALFAVLGLPLALLGLYYQAERRREQAENVLPDLLLLIAANLRAGMNPMLALRQAARPEFVPLYDEILFVTNKSLGTGSFTDALLELPRCVRSELVERAMQLYATALISGGNVPVMLESLAADIRETQKMKQRLMAGVNIYLIFIMFTLAFGMPVLLAVSLKFFELTLGLPTLANSAAAPAVPGTSVATLNLLYAGVIIATSLLASLLMGVARDGRKLNGLKYFLPLALTALTVFYLTKTLVLDNLLRGLG